MFWHHVLPIEGQLFPAPHLCLRNQRNSYPQNGTSGDEKQEQLRWDPPTQGTRFHIIKTFWYLGASFSIFICTSGFSQQVMVFENIIFPFTSSACNPLCSHSCNYCFHMNYNVLPTLQLHSQKYPCWLQKHMLPKTFSSRSNCRQARSCVLLAETTWSGLSQNKHQEPHMQ